MPRRRRESPAAATASPPKRRRYNLRVTSSRRRRLLGGDQAGRRPYISEEDFWKKYRLLTAEEKPGTSLKVSSVNLHLKRNRAVHHTRDYQQEDLILRRGQSFTISVSFDRDIDRDDDIINLQLITGQKPQESKGSLIRIPIDVTKSRKEASDLAKNWTAKVDDINKNNVKLVITPPPDAIIGIYKLYVETTLKEKEDDEKRFKFDGEDIIMIFNPWCKDDTVYLEDEKQREEYVLNESGRIWIGSAYRNYGRPWNFGQFDDPCLDAALYLLELGELADSGRTSVVSVVRVISSWANSMDNDGVLEGRWEDTYPEGIEPWKWTGSVAILRHYMQEKKSVKYGQCWVFSGLVTTLLRSLGIPTRSVTNFESAHDTDCSMTIDKHYDEDGDSLSWLNDSVWNFHVWNESWFKRPDLPDGYDGWQVHDATPQESSEGVMRCGPASLTAIKKGHVYLNYDAPFIYSEINGDRITWEVKKGGAMEVMSNDKRSVGRKISTKAVGSDERHDLTHDYKYPEGSVEERKVAVFVNRFSTRRKCNIYDIKVTPEMKLDFNLPDATMIGDNFEVEVIVKNTTKEDKDVKIKTTIVNAFYTGVPGKTIKSEESEVKVTSKAEKKVLVKVNHKDYQASLHPEGRFHVYVTAKNLKTAKMTANNETFELAKPDLTIKMPDQITAKEETKAVVSFENRTRMKLTNGTLSVEGSGLLEATELKTKKTIQPGEKIEMTLTLEPKRSYYYRKELVVTLSFDQISNIDGSKKVKVLRAPEEPDSDDE